MNPVSSVTGICVSQPTMDNLKRLLICPDSHVGELLVRPQIPSNSLFYRLPYLPPEHVSSTRNIDAELLDHSFSIARILY